MASGRNIEYLTIVQCTSKLITTISLHPLKLSQKLFEQNLVSDAQVSENLSQTKDDYLKASSLLDVVTRQIEAYPEKYESFLRILSGFPWSRDVVKDIRRQYGMNKAMVAPYFNQNDDTLIKIVEENKKKLELRYATLVTNVAERLEQIHADFNSLHLFATTYFTEEKQTLAKTASIAEIFEALSGLTKWKCDSISALEEICKKIGNCDRELMKMIHDYKSDLAGFRATTKIVHFMRCTNLDDIDADEIEQDTSSIQQTTAEYDIQYCHKLSVKLKARITEKCLDYIHQLWASLAEYLYLPALPALLKKIQDGCIEVMWLIPTSTARQLLRKLQRPVEVAQHFKIIRMKLDNQILYCENTEDKDKDLPVTTQPRMTHPETRKLQCQSTILDPLQSNHPMGLEAELQYVSYYMVTIGPAEECCYWCCCWCCHLCCSTFREGQEQYASSD